jgi:hypothetical protein
MEIISNIIPEKSISFTDILSCVLDREERKESSQNDRSLLAITIAIDDRTSLWKEKLE